MKTLKSHTKTRYNALSASVLLASGFISTAIPAHAYPLSSPQEFMLTNSMTLNSNINDTIAIQNEIQTIQNIIQEINNDFNEKVNYVNNSIINSDGWAAISPTVEITNSTSEDISHNTNADTNDQQTFVPPTMTWFYGSNDIDTLRINGVTEVYSDLTPFEVNSIVVPGPGESPVTVPLEFAPFTTWQTIAVPSGQLSYDLTLDDPSDHQETVITVSGHMNEFTTIVESDFPLTDGKVLYFGDGTAPSINHFGYHPPITLNEPPSKQEIEKIEKAEGIPDVPKSELQHEAIIRMHELGLTNSQIETLTDFWRGDILGAIGTLLNPFNFFEDLFDILKLLFDEVVNFFDNIFDDKASTSGSVEPARAAMEAIAHPHDTTHNDNGYSQNYNILYDANDNKLDESSINPININDDYSHIISDLFNNIHDHLQLDELAINHQDYLANNLDDLHYFDTNNIFLDSDILLTNTDFDF